MSLTVSRHYWLYLSLAWNGTRRARVKVQMSEVDLHDTTESTMTNISQILISNRHRPLDTIQIVRIPTFTGMPLILIVDIHVGHVLIFFLSIKIRNKKVNRNENEMKGTGEKFFYSVGDHRFLGNFLVIDQYSGKDILFPTTCVWLKGWKRERFFHRLSLG